MKKKINAEIIADSTNDHGNRITTYVLTYPRFIHAELLTHRLFSRNAASSRAIPASKMIKDIEEDPFIPVAWQKAHKGMQGTEYFDHTKEVGSRDVLSKIKREWLKARDEAVHRAKNMVEQGITKQLINRILEPYQWYTCICTFTEGENFFELRCPQYDIGDGVLHKSRKDAIQSQKDLGIDTEIAEMFAISELDWLKANKGAGEIHISLLAEAMWDARNESQPKKLKAGEWHIPFSDNLDASADLCAVVTGEVDLSGSQLTDTMIRIATARCARVSYLNFEGKDDYEADIDLYHSLLTRPYTNKKGFTFTEEDPKHMSPSEHCARAMSKDEIQQWGKCEPQVRKDGTPYPYLREYQEGWSGNFRGFVQLRKEIEL